MKKIAQHIETLIRRHDYVIVPGFGGFVTQQQTSIIEVDALSAPMSVVGFNPLMNVSDGLLAIEISRAENISFREATLMIEAEVFQLKQQLQQTKKVCCGNLGELYLSQDNKVLFTPNDNSAFLPSNYGLSTIFYSTIEQHTQETTKTLTISLPTKRKFTRYAAVGIIALGLFLSAPKLNDAHNNTASFNPISFLNITKQNLEQSTYSSSTNPTGITAIAEAEPDEQAHLNDQKFHVIVGCMETQKKANEIYDNLKRLHFKNALILPRIKTYRVSIESFDSEKEAVLYMENLRKSNKLFSDAWVLKPQK